MIFAIDFDGTCTTHDFPKIGKDIGAVPVLKRLIRNGHQLILWTMRNEGYLNSAVEWFLKNEIELWGIQGNPDQHKWSKSPKAYAHIYIDDAALGCPLKWNRSLSDRPFVDWKEAERQLECRNLLEIK